jgi:chromate reductase, NAD(P)H dehydrogenase (quinone)
VNKQPRILVFAGSLRSASLNKKLARIAAESVRQAGGESTLIDLRDYPMPLYDGDLEALSGIPESARALKRIFREHHALLIASPENNGSVSAPLKNTLDWVSRADSNEPGSLPYRNKVAGLLATSPSSVGGLRGLFHLRLILNSLGVLVLPMQVGVGRGHEAFSAEGELLDAKQRAAVDQLCQDLVRLAAKFVDG